MGTQIEKIEKVISVVSTLIALQVVTLAAVVGVTWYSHNELSQQLVRIASAGAQPSTPDAVEDWDVFVREHNAAVGREDAAVVVVEYSDFQCPFCKKYSDETRRQLVAKYGDRLRMVFKHYPLSQIHPQAMSAAIAAQCAHREGKFWQAHELFFNQPNALDKESLIAAGNQLGLSDSYRNCVINEETKAEVEQDVRDGAEVGVRGTPTMMVNGQFLVGAVSEDAFKPIFEKAGLSLAK